MKLSKKQKILAGIGVLALGAYGYSQYKKGQSVVPALSVSAGESNDGGTASILPSNPINVIKDGIDKILSPIKTAVVPNDTRLQDPETLENYKFLLNAYNSAGPVKFITSTGTEKLISNFRTWLDRFMINNNISDLTEALINRAHWQGGTKINRIVTMSGLGNTAYQLS